MVCHCKCCGRKQSKLLQRSPWKTIFSALYGTYTVPLHELKAMLKVSTLAGHSNLPETTGQQTTQEGSFREVQRWKQHTTDETTGT
jgi:hypothetical protein